MNNALPVQDERGESDLLAPFEIENIPEAYREYYSAKRANFRISIKHFPALWRYYLLLDKIWLREFEDLNSARDSQRMFPLLIFFNTHAKIRVGLELAFSSCMAEARSILRDAIECAAHAHRMMTDTELQKTWLNKNEAEEAFKDAFERHKREGLFGGLGELYKLWGQLSETGSHSTINAMCDRFRIVESDTHVRYMLNYCGVEPQLWAQSVFSMLLASSLMEKVMFRDFESRLDLDDGLLCMRADAQLQKEKLRRDLITLCGIKRPPSKSAIYTS
jgi:hypothetical protein